MTIEDFATKYRVRMRRDECGDKIIPGKRGHLYFDDSDGLCLMVTDGKPAMQSRWAALGGRLWMGDISPNAEGRRVQDVWIKGIPIENAAAAIKMARIRAKRTLSAEELELRRACAIKARESLSKQAVSRPRNVRRR